MDLASRDHWIFDMDGTLTVAVHDFDAIRRELDLPPGQPILEALAALPGPEAAPRYRRLDEIELELCARARAQAGAAELLQALRGRGARLGILTRNSERIARETLRRCALLEFFDAGSIVGRESARPKPHPEGIHTLLRRWGTTPASAVIVGDYRFDLEAGRSAGITTVYLDVERSLRWAGHADHSVNDLCVLRRAVTGA